MTTRILTGDALAVLRGLPADTFHCCVTSPPYYGLRDYGVEGQIGLEETPDAFVARLAEVFRQVRRVLRPDGTCWLNIGDSYANDGKWGGSSGGKNAPSGTGDEGYRRRRHTGLKPKDLIGIPWMLAFALRADGWFLRSDIIWHKPNPMPESIKDRPTSAHEHVFLLAKSDRYFYDAEAIGEPISPATAFDRVEERPSRPDRGFPGRASRPSAGGGRLGAENTRNARNVWSISTQPFAAKRLAGWEEDHDHYAVMPPALAERCIQAGTSERGCCAACGAPWERVMGRGEPDREWQRQCGGDAAGGYAGQSIKGHDAAGVQNASDVKRRVLAGLGTKRTTGWEPTCDCSPAEPVACHVLDPFGGAGTTGLVADRLARDATLIEINPKNVRLARARLTADSPLMAAVEVA